MYHMVWSVWSIIYELQSLILYSWIILAKTKSWNSGGQPEAHGGICAPHIKTWNQNRIHSVENENNGGHPIPSTLPSFISSRLYFNFGPIFDLAAKWNHISDFFEKKTVPFGTKIKDRRWRRCIQRAHFDWL